MVLELVDEQLDLALFIIGCHQSLKVEPKTVRK